MSVVSNKDNDKGVKHREDIKVWRKGVGIGDIGEKCVVKKLPRIDVEKEVRKVGVAIVEWVC